MDMQQAIQHWPAPAAQLREYKDGKATYEPVRVTVDRVFENAEKGTYGLKFKEDTTPSGNGYTGVIWNCAGAWDNDTKTRLPYAGDKYYEGEVIEAALKVTAGQNRNFYDVSFANRIADQAPPPQQEAQPAPQGDPRDGWTDAGAPVHSVPMLTTEHRIAKAQAWNGLTAMLAALLQRGDINSITSADGTELDFGQMVTEWLTGYELLKAGKTPFTEDESAEEDPPMSGHAIGDWDNPAQELDQQADSHMAEMRASDEDDVEQVPGW